MESSETSFPPSLSFDGIYKKYDIPSTLFNELISVINKTSVMVSIWKYGPGEWPNVYITDNIETILGYTSEEFISGKVKWTDIMPPEDVSRITSELPGFLSQESGEWSHEFRMISRSGETLWFENRNKVISRNNGIPEYIQSVMIDISARKKSEEEVQTRERQLKMIFNAAIGGICIVDPKGILIMSNPWWSEYTGYSDEEIRSMPFINFTPPDEQEMSRKRFFDFVKSKSAGYSMRKRIVRKDGTILWADTAVAPVKNAEGDILMAVLLINDITDRLKAEVALAESEEKFRLIAESVSDVIWIHNIPGNKFSYISPSVLNLLGYSPEEVLESDTFISATSESAAKIKEFIKSELPRFIENGNQVSPKFFIEARQRHRNGTLIWTESAISFRMNQLGEPEVVGLTRDIDLRKKMEEELLRNEAELRELNATKDKFFSIIAHDLRSPFQSFLGLMEILADEQGDFSPGEMHTFASETFREGKNVYQLLENLLEWANINRGVLQSRPEILDISNVIDYNIGASLENAKSKDIALTSECPRGVSVFADKRMTDSILRNLISNALKYTERGGKVTLRGEVQEDGFVEISVEDNGVGMCSEYVLKLFRIGEKIGTKGTEAEPSAGIGLLLCKEFAVKNGGEIRVESEPGVGSRFILRLPGG
ncbi:MAG: PAS domain S-box protein [Ignavibacteriaceae bacterium]